MTERPSLTYDGAYFVGELALPAWARPGEPAPCAGIEAHAPDGEMPDAWGAALDVLALEQAAIRTATLEALFARYADRAGVRSVEAFGDLVTPNEIVLHENEQDGLAYVGLSLRCPWDQEHGLGVMLHGVRVLSAGGADIAALGWSAARNVRPVAPTHAKPAPAGVMRKPAPAARKPAKKTTAKKTTKRS